MPRYKDFGTYLFQYLHPHFFQNKLIGDVVKVGKVNCAEFRNKPLCRRHRIAGYPTVLRYVGGNVHRPEMFRGVRSLDRFLSFAEEGLEKKFPGRISGLRETFMSNQDEVELKESFGSRDGCNIVGYVEVPRVPGHLHFISSAGDEDNAANHQLHHLSFGPRLDSDFAVTHLKDHRISVPEKRFSNARSHEHYMKILPTRHVKSDFAVETFRYTMKSHSNLKIGDGTTHEKMTSEVRFTYDISPLVVEYREETVPFYHFMTSLCAVVGGVYALIGFADMLVYYSSGIREEKVSLGKFT